MLHSLTKIFVSTAIFQLIENNQLTLEDYINEHLDDLPTNWGNVQIQHLLSHSSGLPEIVKYGDLPFEQAKNKVYNDDFQFKTGERFGYTQTNFWLLNRLIKKVSSQNLEDYILENQFDSSTPASALFLSTNMGSDFLTVGHNIH